MESRPPRQDTPRRKRRSRSRTTGEETAGALPQAILIGMAAVGVVCIATGCARRGLIGYEILSAALCIGLGIGFMAVGLLELEWLEQFIGFSSGCMTFVVQWIWMSDGSLSEAIGRRRAAVWWVIFALPTFAWGCAMALKLVPVASFP